MKLTRKHWMLIIGLAVIALLVWQVWDIFNRPLDTRLAALSTQVSIIKVHTDATQPPTNDPIGLPTPLPTPENYTFTANNSPVNQPPGNNNARTICGGPPVLFYLVAGDDEHNLADSIRIVRVDFTKPEVTVLAIQRATWVSIPFLATRNIDTGLINASHSWGEYFLGPGEGIWLLAQTIQMNFGINIDRYIDVNYNAFIKAVDAVGGMDVYLPDSLDGTLQGLKIFFTAGWQHMDGATALKYVRIRFPDSDWARITRQTEFGKDLYQKLTTTSMLSQLPGLAANVRPDVFTDLSPAEISTLVCLATRVQASDIRFYEIGLDMVIPTTLKDTAKSQVMLPKWDIIRPFVQDFIYGNLH